ncbi:MAG: phosphate transport system ATP-binding protein [Candidatus Saganbacteria bacterium]|uniref:Phosphate transport system ATP-binding protein n=1 Tax=Candidatus Saganbacteria bacterium TaxID=2575572 RepID=A0A833NRE0_UNCSA|nr:MAG: phosphate transport system ATP-binding protein [Candidatus Saganbacteria bacterium]
MSNKIEIEKLNLHYTNFHALINITIDIEEKKITSIIGPSGCGKSTLLRVLNRINDTIEGVKVSGKIMIDGENIFSDKANLVNLRKKVGMVFQRPNPFPLSIYENIIYGPKVHGEKNKNKLEKIAEESLRAVLLFDELKDRLKEPALELSLEQQQRLCIARLLANKSEVILLDEPCSALDPLATLKIEELLQILKKDYTILIVTHNMQQAARASDNAFYMLLGEMVECGETKQIFTSPKDKRTEDYITGRFG